MRPTSSLVLGVDIGGTKTAVMSGRAGPEGIVVLERRSFATVPDERPWAATTTEIRRLAGQLVEAAPERPEAIGVSCGGPLDSKEGVLLSPPNLPGWDRVPILKELQTELGIPAFLQNDANACALAEWRFGAGQGVQNLIFLTFGTGMGAGLILGGRLYEGTGDLAGEVGHLRLAEDGPEGYGKRGSFEGFCSGGGIARRAQEEAGRRLSRGEAVAFCAGPGDLEAVTARSVAEAAEAGDLLAREIFSDAGRWLGRGIAMLIDILNPQRIVIGGIFARRPDLLEPAMRSEILREALGGSAAACEVVAASLGERIGDIAALSVALEGAARIGEGP